MSLTAALNTAKSSLAAAQVQTQITSSNIASVNTAGATRKIANVVTGPNGTVTVTSIAQSSNSVLFRNMLDATSKLSVAAIQSDAYARFNEVVGDTNAKQSPQAKVAALNDALNTLANTPGNYDLARNAAQAAQDLVTTIRSNADTVQTVRRDADNQLSIAADDMNRILGELESVNRSIVSGTAKGQDVTDQSDQRDRLVQQLSEYVGVSVRTRGNNDMVIYTDSGVTMLENTARAVRFDKTASLNAGEDGNALYIDGVPVTGANSYMPVKNGSVFGLTDVRDRIATAYGAQLDELSRGLISSFSESNQTGGLSVLSGLFTSKQLQPEALGPVDIGASTATAASAGAISFTVTYEGVDYKVSGTVDATQATPPANLAARMTALIAEGKSSSGAVLGAGRVKIAENAGGTALELSGTGLGQSVLKLSGLTGSPAAGLTSENTYTPTFTSADFNPNAGLSATLTLAADVLEHPEKIRDGVNSATAAFKYNSANLGAFSDRINALASAMNSLRKFDGSAGADPSATLSGYAASSISWIQDARSAASQSALSMQTLVSKTSETLSNETGINLDTELTRLIELERSFQASAKIISTVDQMLAALLQSI